MRALGRRSAAALPPTLEYRDLALDPNRRAASRGGRRLDLSPKEFALLECLLASGGRVVPAEELLERVWDEAADPFTTTVKTTVRRLRWLRRTLRLQLALAYAALFFGSAIVLLTIPFLGFKSTFHAGAPGRLSAAAQKGADVHRQITGSDELRTPVTAERALLQVALADLAVIARDSMTIRDQEARRRGITVEATLCAAAVLGDPSLIESLAANLADNALRHNVRGGRGEISTRLTDGQAVLSVRNTGPVIPPGDVSRLAATTLASTTTAGTASSSPRGASPTAVRRPRAARGR